MNAIEVIDQYFQSANDVKVTRALIKREEWEAVKREIMKRDPLIGWALPAPSVAEPHDEPKKRCMVCGKSGADTYVLNDDSPDAGEMLLLYLCPNCKTGMFHPETQCQECGGPNVTWFTPNEIWNKVETRGILCPVCFIRKAEKAGYDKRAWKIVPEFYESEVPEGCKLIAVNAGGEWSLEVHYGDDLIAILEWPYGDDETRTAEQLREYGFEIA